MCIKVISWFKSQASADRFQLKARMETSTSSRVVHNVGFMYSEMFQASGSAIVVHSGMGEKKKAMTQLSTFIHHLKEASALLSNRGRHAAESLQLTDPTLPLWKQVSSLLS